MSSSFGKIFKLTTWGESHGPALGVVVEGCPAGVPLTVDEIQRQLDRRRVGQSEVTTPRGEKDRAEILSGVFEGITGAADAPRPARRGAASPRAQSPGRSWRRRAAKSTVSCARSAGSRWRRS